VSSKVLGELNNLHKKGIDTVEPSDLTGAVRGRTNLYNHLASAIKNAEKTVNIMTTKEGITRKAEALKNALQKAKNNGVKIKIIAPKGTASKILSQYGKIKSADGLPARFCVVDGKQVTFMVLDDSVHPNYDFGVWVNAENFAKNFENMFGILWDKN